MAFKIALCALLLLGAVASKMAASARGSCASGMPSCRALSTQAFVTAMAMGQARPTSSAAITSSRLQAESMSPPSKMRAR